MRQGMSYTVLARRYRSDSFNGVVGQDPIARTLRNAIQRNKVHHAYLFTGTRGVGKTSTARILARALNAPDTLEDCPTPPDHERYPPVDVQQRMAEAIMRGEDLNVIEIDGASNNSVDQARQLIANAYLSPTGNALYKVYIIDEVHMLSNAAFNALLKTMEEPPDHVKFILCTTEVHKVPATIQSRCQRFDFHNIPTALIAQHLEAVLDKEGIQAEKPLIWQVARLAGGSMRDGLSLMDRLIATGEQPIQMSTLEQMLGLPPQELIERLVDALAEGDLGESLKRAGAILDHGISQDQLVAVLIERLRQLMLICACGVESDLIELSEDQRRAAQRQAQQFDAPGLVHMIALCENLQRSGRLSATPRALLDATVVRLALAEKMADVVSLLRSTSQSQPAQPAAVGAGGPEKKR
jgi:DNA polymerase-3 subunit gamma/tau